MISYEFIIYICFYPPPSNNSKGVGRMKKLKEDNKQKIYCKKIFFIFSILIFVFAIGCTSPIITGKAVSANADKEIIEIGFIGPLTGPIGDAGQGIMKGAQLAVEEINSYGGINGKQLKILYEDGQCFPKAAVNAATKLITINKVPLIIGPACSTSIFPVASIANQYKTPIIGTLDSSKAIGDAGEYVFTNGFSVESGAELMAKFAYDKLSIRTVTILYDIDDWAQTLANTFKLKFEELGGNVLLVQKHNLESRDYRTELLKMKQLNPDAMYIIDLELSGLVFKQARELGIKSQFLGADNLGFSPVIESSAAAVEGAYFSYQMKFDNSNKELNSFKTKYAARYNTKAKDVLYPAIGYDNVMLVASVLEKAGTDSVKIQQELLKTKDFKGVLGKTSFKANGVANRTQHINAIMGGEFVAVI